MNLLCYACFFNKSIEKIFIDFLSYCDPSSYLLCNICFYFVIDYSKNQNLQPPLNVNDK